MTSFNCISITDRAVTEGWSEEELNAEYGVPEPRMGLVPLMIRDIVMDNTSPRRHITQARICELLDFFPYSMSLDRKTCGRVVNTLCSVFPYIVKGEDGSVWYDREGDGGFPGGQAA